MKKKMFSLMLTLVLSLTSLLSASANGNEDKDFGSILNQAGILEENGASQSEVIDFFASQGITVQDVSTKYVDIHGREVAAPSEFSTFSLDAVYREITNWTGTDSSKNYYAWAKVRMIADIQQGWVYEMYPASYDVLSINWNPNYLSYVSNGIDTGSGNVWLADADQRDNGSVLFSLKDNPLPDHYVQVYVKLKAKKAGSTTTSAKYTHTYDQTSSSESYSGNASWTWGSPLTVGVSYSVTTTSKEANWSKAATASVSVTL